jgi:hypothetical protein
MDLFQVFICVSKQQDTIQKLTISGILLKELYLHSIGMYLEQKYSQSLKKVTPEYEYIYF